MSNRSALRERIRKAGENKNGRKTENTMCGRYYVDDETAREIRRLILKLDQRFHCFGCQADGDVIDFTAAYFGLSVRQAAEKLAKDFGVRYEVQRPPDRGKCKRIVTTASLERNYGKLERICFSILGQYREQLQFWKELYAPKRPDEEWVSRFCEALDRLTRVEYLMDVLLYSPLEKRVELLLSAGKEITGYAGRLQKPETGTAGSSENTSR